MQPKCIILNGPLGVEKSTLATRYADEHPLTLKIDIDEVRRMISGYRERQDKSGPLSKKLAGEMMHAHLQEGHDVIISQIFTASEPIEKLRKIAHDCGADFYEFVLIAPKVEMIERFIERGKAAGYPDGFRPGGLVDINGREKKLEQLYDDMMASAEGREVIFISSKKGDIDGVYREIVKHLQ